MSRSDVGVCLQVRTMTPKKPNSALAEDLPGCVCPTARKSRSTFRVKDTRCRSTVSSSYVAWSRPRPAGGPLSGRPRSPRYARALTEESSPAAVTVPRRGRLPEPVSALPRRHPIESIWPTKNIRRARVTKSYGSYHLQPQAAQTRSEVADRSWRAKFINCLMWDGKKSIAQNIFYDALEIVK